MYHVLCFMFHACVFCFFWVEVPSYTFNNYFVLGLSFPPPPFLDGGFLVSERERERERERG